MYMYCYCYSLSVESIARAWKCLQMDVIWENVTVQEILVTFASLRHACAAEWKKTAVQCI